MKVVFCELVNGSFVHCEFVLLSLLDNKSLFMTMQDKVVLKNQTRDSEEEGWSWRRCHQLFKKEDARALVSHGAHFKSR